MKYDWDVEKLKYIKRSLIKIRDSEDKSDDFDLDSLLFDIENINEMLKIIKNPYSKVRIYDETDDDQFFDKNKLVSNNKYALYNEVLPYVETLMLKQYRKMGKYYNDYESKDIIPRLNSTKDLISMAYEVYNSLPTKSNLYKNYFLEYTNPRNHKIKLIQNEINSNFSVYGYIYFFHIPTYNPFIIMTQDKTMEDISVLCHEIGHAIFYNPSVTTLNRSLFLGEVEGYYFEYMTRKYLEKMGYDKSILDELEYRRFTTIFDGYVSFYMMHLLLEKYKFNKKITLDKVMKYLITKVDRNFNLDNVNEAFIRYSLNQNNFNVSKYFMSYLAYLDIEELDKVDPEYAFRMLREVCKIEGDYIIPKLRKHNITFMDDGCKNLEKKIRQMNKI